MAVTIASEPLPSEGRLIWIDLEMTGLSPETDRIIEIAVVVTDCNMPQTAKRLKAPVAITWRRWAEPRGAGSIGGRWMKIPPTANVNPATIPRTT